MLLRIFHVKTHINNAIPTLHLTLLPSLVLIIFKWIENLFRTRNRLVGFPQLKLELIYTKVRVLIAFGSVH